jgi:DNA polymerase-3 subunit beta
MMTLENTVEMEKEAELTAFQSYQQSVLTIKTDVLKAALQKIARSISSKTTVQVLTGVYFFATEQGITLRAANSNFYTERKIDNNDKEKNFVLDGAEAGVVFPGAKFVAIINKMTGKNIKIEFNGLNTTIKSKGAKFSLGGLHINEFPAFPVVNAESSFTLPAGVLLSMYQKTAYATSNNESRPILTGILHDVTEKQFSLAATDGHRLSVMNHEVEVDTEDMRHTIPVISVKEAMKLLPDSTMVTVGFDKSHVVYEMDGVTMYSRALNDTYPDLKRLIPPGAKSEIRIAASDLKEALERTALNVNENKKSVAILMVNPEDNQLRLKSVKTETGESNEDMRTTSGSGEGVVITGDVKFLYDAVKSYPANAQLKIQFNGFAPYVIKMVNGNDQNLDLIVPIRLVGIPEKPEIENFNPGEVEEDPFAKQADAYAEQAEEDAA